MSSNRIFNRVCCLQARVRHLPHRPIRVRPLGGDGRRHYVDRRVSEWRKTPQRELIVDLPVPLLFTSDRSTMNTGLTSTGVDTDGQGPWRGFCTFHQCYLTYLRSFAGNPSTSRSVFKYQSRSSQELMSHHSSCSLLYRSVQKIEE